ncbi:hypothetical protein PR202_ga20588 [Eleusine coracana subsp. coracana]|uniref:Reverse transcriptase zinc-binding domain-containing protein n=1 Tax=Eleusine coracana subsp. coracana TaxID=191504 RepID=A0AAV5CX18_ELECO|nr:hypothetical protein PR202_ga20588 [Eleusine coracana subsp. coracana]
MFWKDRWVHGCLVQNLAPSVFTAMPTRIRNNRTVAEALEDDQWILDTQGGLSWIGIRELLRLGDCLENFVLTDEEDRHVWNLDASSHYSSRSAYKAYFNDSISFEPWKRLWKTWAPAKCKLFLWLAIRNKCWTANRLAKRGLDHPEKCPLCDQEEEMIQHLLTTCVVAREVWYKLLQPLSLASSAPRRRELSFADWWHKTMKKVKKEDRKGVNFLIILGDWIIWKHRNACVFDGAAPSVHTILSEVKDE